MEIQGRKTIERIIILSACGKARFALKSENGAHEIGSPAYDCAWGNAQRLADFHSELLAQAQREVTLESLFDSESLTLDCVDFKFSRPEFDAVMANLVRAACNDDLYARATAVLTDEELTRANLGRADLEVHA